MAKRDLLGVLRLQKGIDRGKNLLIGPCAEIVDSRRSEVFIRVPTPSTPSPSSHLGRRDLCRGIMDRCRGKTSTFFTKLAYGVGKKLYPAVVPLSRSLGSPAPQTSLSTSPSHSFFGSNANLFHLTRPVFELPDELILSILSYISPDPPRSTSDHAWFRIQHSWRVDDYLQQRVEFLRPLSMTCRAMRLRFLPWIWERLELPPPHDWGPRGVNFGKKFNAIANVLHVDAFMATSVKCFCALLRLLARADSSPLKVCENGYW